MIGNIPYTPRVKKVLSLAAKEARSLNHTYVGTEHILLGLLHEGDGVAARVLKNLGVDIEVTRNYILSELDPNFHAAPVSKVTPPTLEPEPVPEPVDTSKRYDVYCSEGNQMVVYRNVLFKSTRKLLSKGEYGVFYQFLQIEQADGKVVFIARTALIKF